MNEWLGGWMRKNALRRSQCSKKRKHSSYTQYLREGSENHQNEQKTNLPPTPQINVVPKST